MKNSHNRKLHTIPGLVFAIPIIAIFLLTFSVNIQAASDQDYFPMYQNHNNIFTEANMNSVFNYFDSENNFIFVSYRFTDSGSKYFNYALVSKSSVNGSVNIFATKNNNLYQFDLYRIGSVDVTVGGARIGSNGNIYSNTVYGYNQFSYFNNSVSSNYSNSTDYFSNFMLKTNDTSSAKIVLIYGNPILVPDTGHAQDPLNNIPTIDYPIGMHPSSAPTVPSYTAPTIPSLPSFDLDHPFESLFNILDWFGNGVIDTLNSFIQIFIDWLQFIGNLIVWLFKSFIDFCTSFWNWLFRIFKFLFEPIYDFLSDFFKFLFNEDEQLSIFDLIKDFKDFVISWCSGYWSNSWLSNFFTNLIGTYDYFATLFAKLLLFFDKVIQLGTVNNEFTILNLVKALFVPDVPTVTAHFMGHDDFYFYSTGHAIVDKGNYIVTTITSITPAKTFYVPSTTWHEQTIGGFYLDFSWYDDYKTYGDLIISTFLSLSFVYWVLINMSNFIRGQSSVGSDISRLEK